MNIRPLNTVKKFNMLLNVHTVIVGISGGADSIALLHFLNSISREYKINIIAAHLNHGLRGEESERDEKFVRLICKSWGVKLHVKKQDIRSMAASLRQGLEQCGRNARYTYFDELAKDDKFKIATAHTLSDNMETLVMNLARGTGLNGLCGIPPVRGKIIRPFIDMSRDEVEEYCRENNLKFVNDSTNFSREYTRNKIRLDVIPVLKNINPDLDSALRRFFINVSEDNRYLNNICEKELENIKHKNGFDVQKIKLLPNAIKRRVLLEILKSSMDRSPENKDVENVIKLINGNIKCLPLDKHKIISIKEGFLSINCVVPSKRSILLWQYKAENINILTEAKKTFIIYILNSEEYSQLAKKDIRIEKNAISMDNINRDDVFFRNRRAGDVFSPLGRGITKKIKKLFNEMRIPLPLRDNTPMLACQEKILWIYGVGVSNEFKVRPNTSLIAVILER